MYGREFRFYTQIGPTVPLRAPQCYYANFVVENNDFVLLLEDLQAYRLGDQVEGCTIDELRAQLPCTATPGNLTISLRSNSMICPTNGKA